MKDSDDYGACVPPDLSASVESSPAAAQAGVNPKDAVGSAKAGMRALSGPVLLEMALGMTEGEYKYGRHNYRAVPVRASVYYDALWRHVLAWWEGEDVDPKSGLHHLTKALSDLAVIRDAQIQGTWFDDRPLRTRDGWQDPLDEKAAALRQQHPNPVAPYLEATKGQSRA